MGGAFIIEGTKDVNGPLSKQHVVGFSNEAATFRGAVQPPL